MRPYILKVVLGLMPFLLAGYSSIAQVFDPSDVNQEYDSRNPPTQPALGQPGKWVKTSRLTSWSTSSYKCYIYNGIPFRLKFPKTYVAGNGKKYPLYLFFHGAGEKGSIYDNEYQLLHGGQWHATNVDYGSFDGFLLYPQSSSGVFSSADKATLIDLIENFLVPQVQVDPFRIIVNGLSVGGSEVWDSFIGFQKYFAAFLPISDAEYKYGPYIVQNKWTPIWLFQGALDNNPPPVQARTIVGQAQSAGANLTYTEYPDRGHDCWNNAWLEPNYFPYLQKAYKSNPWPDAGRTEFCPGENVNITLGVAPGMDGYQWRQGDTDDGIIPNSNQNTIVATSLGKYYCKVRIGTIWSDWSPIPVELKTKTVTVSPDPQLASFSSKVLPAPDGSTQVQLMVPNNYASYKWTRVGSSDPLSTINTYTASPGSYQVTVQENFGCTSTASNPFTVVNANGPNKPDAVKGLVASKLSKTSLKLNWIAPTNAANQATNFEIYMATKPGGPYQFVGITDGAARSFDKTQLVSGAKYYFVVRAVNATAGSDLSAEVSQTTDIDDQPPVSPDNLKVIGTTRNSIDIQWGAAADDIGVARYNIYINGVKSYTSNTTSFTINNLQYNTGYNIAVTAVDLAENESVPSNQVTAKPVMMGLRYKYYLGDWSVLPDFNLIPVQSSGFVPNITLVNKTQTEKYAFMWEGFIRIDAGGTYTFRSNSDDGSKVYINTPYSYYATPVVNNDNTHGATTPQDGPIYLAPGVYPIIITYFQKTSSSSITISWKKPGSNSFVAIPDNVFTETVPAASNLPAAPSALTATALSYKKVALSWTDNSNNETGFELSRSTDSVSGFSTIAKVTANTTSFQDTTVGPSTKYYYRVRAINANGESGYDRKGLGIDYAYYETDALTALPTFDNLIPVRTGHVGNISLGMQLRSDNFAVKYDGFITVPYTGNYKFSTTSDDGSQLYLNGNRIVNNDGVHSSAKVTSSNVSLTAGTLYPISVRFFEVGGSEILTVMYQKTSSGGGGTLSEQVIPVTSLGQGYVSLTTPDAPPAPDAPTDLHVISTSATSAKIAWANTAPNITKFEVYRSFGNNQEYISYATVPVANTYYTDTVLFPNSTVYYKVRAIGTDSKSDFSNEATALTLGVMPSVDVISTQYMKYGTQFKVYVTARSSLAENLNLQVDNLPSFGSFTVTGNGKGEILFNNPAADQQKTFSNIKVTVTNPQGNASSRSFSLIVNNNALPVVSTGQRSISIDENATKSITLNGSDADGDALNWSFSGLPGFVSVVPNNQTAVLTLSPLSGAAGTYTVIAKVNDGKMGTDTLSFAITVNPVTTQTVYVNLSPSTSSQYTPGGKWNSVGKVLALVTSFPATATPGLKDENGNGTGIQFSFGASASQLPVKASYSGMTTGNNSGVYPDAVLSGGYWFQWNESYTMTFTGLNQNKKYSFTFLGSFNYTNASDDVSTQLTINGTSKTINSNRNTQNTVTISDVTPNTSGIVVVNVTRPSTNGTSGYYLNSVVISTGASGTAAPPGKVGNFAGKFQDDAVLLTWTNTTSVVTTHEVYRSNALQGPFTLLNPGANNGTSAAYTDNTVQGNKTYYYMVRSKNSAGATNTDIVKVVVPNKTPVLVTKEVLIKTVQTLDATIQASDDPSDVVKLVPIGLPSFATFTDNGDKTGTLHLTPSAGNIGAFDVTIKATDNYGASTTSVVKVYVTDNKITSLYVNFNAVSPADGIWNNFSKSPAANASITGLKNDTGFVTPVGITLGSAWSASGTNGATSGNNSGAYRDTVLQTYYGETGTGTKTVNITGLSTDPNTRYNLVFMSSLTAYDDRTTVFAVGSKTVSVNAANNTDTTVQINDITPAPDGSITFTVAKGSNSAGAYLNAMVIQSYTANTSLLAPDNFKASGTAKDAIKLVWNNRVNGGNVIIYRSASANGTYTPVATVSGNTYTDGGLQSNTEYFYKLKAVVSPDESPYSVTISASTFAYSVFINFNRDTPAALPWNNTNNNPDAGAVFQNFYNDQNVLSGLTLTVGNGFSGVNTSGMNTGNNSGIVPDNVMRSIWWIDVSGSATIKFSGLSHNTSYSFRFFASRMRVDPNDPNERKISGYAINGKKVKLNTTENTTRTISIDNVLPDENGEVVITISGEDNNYGYLNGLIISGGKIPSDPIDGAAGPVFRESNGSATTASTDVADNNSSLQKSKVSVYPNPFRDDVLIKLSLARNTPKVVIRVTDISGRVVALKELSNVPRGVSQQSPGLNSRNLAPGIYIIQVLGLEGETLPPMRILKTR